MKVKFILGIVLFLTIVYCEKINSPFSSDLTIEPKQLTTTGQDRECFWSPDGNYIAFRSARNTYDENIPQILSELWIMDKDGSNQRPLILIDELYPVVDVRTVSWAANSSDMLVQISVYSGLPKSEIWRVSVGGEKVKLSSSEDWAEQPKYSPDGTKASYLIQENNPSDGSTVYKLYAANVELSDTLLVEQGLIGDYQWTYDSKGFIYSLLDRKNSNYDLWKVSSDAKTKTRISETPESEYSISCSSDGKYIVYSHYYNDVYITPVQEFNPTLIMGNAVLPQWIPNRNLILLFSEQTLDNYSFWTESWIVDLHGNIVKKISEGEASRVSFSSTGDFYVYSVNGNIWLDYLSD